MFGAFLRSESIGSHDVTDVPSTPMCQLPEGLDPVDSRLNEIGGANTGDELAWPYLDEILSDAMKRVSVPGGTQT